MGLRHAETRKSKDKLYHRRFAAQRKWNALRLKPSGFQAVHGVDQGCGYPLFRDGMAGIRHDDELRLGERTVQVPGGGHRANDVITALDDNDRQMPDLVHISSR